jgi:hypothetical protein
MESLTRYRPHPSLNTQRQQLVAPAAPPMPGLPAPGSGASLVIPAHHYPADGPTVLGFCYANDLLLNTAIQGLDTTSSAAAAAAQSTANTALANAATAQTTANTGVTNAATAQTTADNAVTYAGTPRRRLLTDSPPAVLSETCYLWRNFATTGQRANEYEIYIPFQGERFAVYSFQDYIAAAGGARYFGRLKEGVPVVNLPSNDVSVTKVGTWAASANTAAYNGTNLQSSTAGDTITATVTGHTLILRCMTTTNAGFATVSIDGDFTAATRLPAVTQTEVDAGWFLSGDIGKRYLETYAVLLYEDEHIVLAEGLADTAHTVVVRVQGTRRSGSSANRVYVSAFAAATSGTLLTDSNASMGYTRDVTNLRTGSNFSAMDITSEYTPDGFTNYQFLGNNHGNETLVAQQFLVDGVVSAPSSGAYVAGREIKSELSTNMTHPSTGATVVASKRTSYVARADRQAQMSCRYRLAWKNPGTIQSGYAGMMHLGTHARVFNTGPVLKQTEFDRLMVGDTILTSFSADNETALGLQKTSTAAAWSTAHDTVAVLHIPRTDLNVDAYSRSTSGLFVQDRSDFTEKFYAARSLAGANETVTAATVHNGEIWWRVFRVANANSRLG